MLTVRVKLLDPELPVPLRQHPGDAGFDLVSRCEVTLEPGARATIPTGIAVAIPPGHAGFVLPRSGLASKHGISLVNAPGLIDSGYRGEIAVVLINTDRENTFRVLRGDRIAQLVIQRVEQVAFERVEELDRTQRGEGGFGSTGTTTGLEGDAVERRIARPFEEVER